MDALFHGMFAEQLVDKDGFVLADAIRAVGGLRFGGGVPPRIVVDDGVGSSEIESRATSFERDEKERDFSGLELLDQSAAVLAAAGEDEVGNVVFLQMLLNDGEHAGELGEEQNATTFF